HHQELFSVGGYVVLPPVISRRLDKTGDGQRIRTAREKRGLRLNRHRKQTLAVVVEQFLSIGRPQGMTSAVLRHLILGTGNGKRLDEDFMPSRFIRDIRDPTAVRRKPAAVLSGFWNFDEWRRFPGLE